MDKNAIKKFATEARRELIHRVTQRALMYGISDQLLVDSDQLPDTTVAGDLLTDTEKAQREALVQKILEDGYEQVMEEVAYTWFNRFSALRFMEVNGYLPSKVRVFTDPDNRFQPEILTEAIHLDIEGLDMEKVFAYKEANDTEGLFQYLLVTQCNALSRVLPGMFQPLADYTELLLPEGLLRDDSVIRLMIDTVPEDDWRDAVQIIGWLYQYYNSEKKDEVFAALKKNVKITKENIPAATQLFTPDWIVRYMVENSLGRTYIQYKLAASGQLLVDSEEKRTSREKEIAENLGWKYYLPEAKQTEEVRKELNRLNPDAFDPMDLRVLDPCAGSGHILAYMFDVLMDIYQDYGYTTRESVRTIVSQNIHGLDIDHRAAQLAYFTVMMKACQYDRRFLTRGIQPKVYAITESNHVSTFARDHFASNPSVKEAFHTLLDELRDAREYGSILTVTAQDWEALEARLEEMEHSLVQSDVKKIRSILCAAETLSQRYDVVVTNPPYMSARGSMSSTLTKYLTKEYRESKNDMSTVFMETCERLTKELGIYALVNQQSWMFLSGFKKLREKLYQNNTVINLIHIGSGAFEGIAGEVVQSVAFSIRKFRCTSYVASYIDMTNAQWKKYADGLKNLNHVYSMSINEIHTIPNGILCYRLGGSAIKQYYNGERLDSFANPRVGMATGENDLFVRIWTEVEFNKVGLGFNSGEDTLRTSYKWFPYNKGGEYRKWYGNRIYLVDWENNGKNITSFKKNRLECGEIEKKNSECWNREYYFMESISWSKVSSGRFAVRYFEPGFIFDVAGCSILELNENLYYIMGALNSELKNVYIESLSPTLNFETGAIKSFPILINEEMRLEINSLVKTCITLEKADWDSYETSWDFKCHPLVNYRRAASGQPSVNSEPNALTTNHYPLTTISSCYEAWKQTCNNRFKQLQANEEELNRIFIDIYGLQDELTPEVADKDVTVHCIYDTKEEIPESLQGSNYVRTKRDEIVSFISYAVGCMLGRYSLEREGLFYAGGDWEETLQNATDHYPLTTNHFIPDEDNVLPICDDEYFQDDIVGRLIEFVRVVYGEETLDENLEFISQALGGKKGERPKDVIRNYFLKDFYKDHCKMYQKRPIYWLFDSGKKNGFKCLVYLHRYRRDTVARIRTDYVHPQQSRYRTILEDLENRLEDAGTAEKVRLRKQIKLRSDQLMEIHEFEEKIHHLADRMITIDLDDGVKKNYAIFQDVLAKIK